MSGVNSSKRQWMSGRVRVLLTLLLALGMLIPVASAFAAGQAGEAADSGQGAVMNDEFCVEGTVIDFDETLMEEGWFVTAIPYGPDGQLDTTGTLPLAETDEDGAFEFDEGLTAGKWQFSLQLPEGWDTITADAFDVTLEYGMDDCVTIRFKVVRPVPVTVLKIDDNHMPLEGWTIRAEPARGNWFAIPQDEKTDANGQANFSLTEGTWIFTEKAPKDTHYTPVIPANGKQELDVEWNGGEPVTIRFKNRIVFRGCIEVYKLDVPPDDSASFGLPGWKIMVKRANGTVATTGMTDSQGYVKFEDLPLGPYTVEEETRMGWSSVNGTSFTVDLKGEDCEVVTFFNEQTPPGFCIEGRKIDTNGKVGIPGWEISATPLDKGGYEPDDVTTDGLGIYRFDFPSDDYRIPGARYKVCEEEVDGWLPHTALCQTVVLPKHPGTCAKAWDFENQQVGHWESTVYGDGRSSKGCSSHHTVVKGESLFGIGAYHGVSASAMLAANSWVNNRPHRYVYPGDSVCIP